MDSNKLDYETSGWGSPVSLRKALREVQRHVDGSNMSWRVSHLWRSLIISSRWSQVRFHKMDRFAWGSSLEKGA